MSLVSREHPYILGKNGLTFNHVIGCQMFIQWCIWSPLRTGMLTTYYKPIYKITACISFCFCWCYLSQKSQPKGLFFAKHCSVKLCSFPFPNYLLHICLWLNAMGNSSKPNFVDYSRQLIAVSGNEMNSLKGSNNARWRFHSHADCMLLNPTIVHFI